MVLSVDWCFSQVALGDVRVQRMLASSLLDRGESLAKRLSHQIRELQEAAECEDPEHANRIFFVNRNHVSEGNFAGRNVANYSSRDVFGMAFF